MSLAPKPHYCVLSRENEVSELIPYIGIHLYSKVAQKGCKGVFAVFLLFSYPAYDSFPGGNDQEGSGDTNRKSA